MNLADDTSNDYPSSPLAGTHHQAFDIDRDDSRDAHECTLSPSYQQKVWREVDEEEEVIGRLQRLATPPPSFPDQDDEFVDNVEKSNDVGLVKAKNLSSTSSAGQGRKKGGVIAIIDLSEEEASTFQDFLSLIYPNLDLTVTWNNIFPLFAFSDKYEVPHLRQACILFLRAALAGRPIEAMALAERHGIEDVYREASRHVLENMPSWEPDELDILNSETLLKLERKRTWFLERLLKLGLANPARDYECHAACLDPSHCARLLHDRWRSQYANAFRYGPPQPSIIWRHLRELETSGGSATNHTSISACQSSSKAWVQLLFDRMYGLPTHGTVVPKFLSIKLKQDYGPRPRPRPSDGDPTFPT
ncbi:hypothetical protein CBS101457_003717 [Exobasidium rhododendri]|nr:hypothetical protein CBS101457_003717 [Exobasidium rhododendri]